MAKTTEQEAVIVAESEMPKYQIGGWIVCPAGDGTIIALDAKARVVTFQTGRGEVREWVVPK